MVQCYIQRRKNGLARLFPTYEIYLKDGDQFLLAARKRKKGQSTRDHVQQKARRRERVAAGGDQAVRDGDELEDVFD